MLLNPPITVSRLDLLKNSAYRVRAIVRHNTRIRLRDPGQAISYMVMPMVMMLVFKPLYVRALNDGAIQIATGLMITFSVFAVAISGNSILVERQWHTWDRLRQSQASAFELMLGKTIPIFILSLVQQTLLITYGCLLVGIHPVRSIGWIALAIVVWAFCVLALGAALATIARSLGELSAISDIGALVLSSMAGALVPLSILPFWARALGHASPGFYALSMMKSAIRGDGTSVLASAGILLVIGLAAGVFAVRRLSRGWGRTRLL
jgi:ABC-2 type transport system permease protein